MLSLIWLQFKHSWKTWANTLFLFGMIGFLIGICTTGIFTLMKEQPNILLGEVDPTPIFLMPIVFGGVTLLFITSGVIRLVILSFKKEYALWTILGSDPNQLALIIGGQLALIGGVGGVIGYLFALPATSYIYDWLQSIVGKRMLPPIHLGFLFSAFLVTLLTTFLLGGFAGFQHARKMFLRNQQEIIHFEQGKQKKQSWLKRMLISLCLLAVGLCYFQIYFQLDAPYYASMPLSIVGLQLFFVLLFFIIVLLYAFVSKGLPRLVEYGFYFFKKSRTASLTTAYWQTLKQPDYLRSFTIPLISGCVLISSFSDVMKNLLNPFATRSAGQTAQENSLIFILYLGAPLLMIVMNAFVLNLLSEKQQMDKVHQFIILGFSPRQILSEKLAETCIYATVCLICSLGVTTLLVLPIHHVAQVANPKIQMTWLSAYMYPVYLFLAILLFLSSSHFLRVRKYIKKVDRKIGENFVSM